VIGHHGEASRPQDDLVDLAEVRAGGLDAGAETRIAPAATCATSASTGMSPLRSGVQAMRQPLTDGFLTAAMNWRVSTSYESGARSSGPAMTESISAVSATVRAMGPVTPIESQASAFG
jgi:hypothetical protein